MKIKIHILLGDSNVSVHIDNSAITSESKNEILGIVLDSKLSFEDHVNCLCERGSEKLRLLGRRFWGSSPMDSSPKGILQTYFPDKLSVNFKAPLRNLVRSSFSEALQTEELHFEAHRCKYCKLKKFLLLIN